MTRFGQCVVAVVLWSVAAVVWTVVLAIGLPLLVVAGVCRGVYRIGRTLIGRGEMSGADDLTDLLRARIDGDDETCAADQLACGCPFAGASVNCAACGWRSCPVHAGAAHLCERDPVVEAFDTNPRNTPVGTDFAAWEQECTHLNRWAKKLGGTR